jgi:tetratricopeptide (TPR) repeat protein
MERFGIFPGGREESACKFLGFPQASSLMVLDRDPIARATSVNGGADSVMRECRAILSSASGAKHDLGKISAAEMNCRAVLAANPMDPAAHNNLGIALSDLGRFDEAEQMHRRALELPARLSGSPQQLGKCAACAGAAEGRNAALLPGGATDPEFRGCSQ